MPPFHSQRLRPRARRGSRPLLVCAVALFVLFTAACVGAPPAEAHGRSLSYSTWTLTDPGAEVRVRISLLELSRLGVPLPLRGARSPSSRTTPMGALLARHVRLHGPSGPCPPAAPPEIVADDDGWVQYRWHVVCAESGPRVVESDLLLDVAPSHLHFARLVLPEGGVRERVLIEGDPRWTVLGPSAPDEAPGSAPEASGLGDYVWLGVEHILTGWDHLAFVFALILLAGRVGEVARLVTGFTIAHSVTLALAVLGVVRPVGHAVEAVIGFSVALVAAENAWLLGGRGRSLPIAAVLAVIVVGLVGAVAPAALPPLTVAGLALFAACHFGLLSRSDDHATWRIALAFAFGLVHGFGFAGILAEMDLPRDRLATALFGFNVGVELGQLAVVVAIWPVLRAVDRFAGPGVARLAPELASAAVCGLGLYWFVLRGLGLG